MPELTDPIPGFDPQQSVTLRALMREQADASAERAVTAFVAGGCRVNCREMSDVHRVVFGASEDGVVGLDQRMADAEKSQKDVRAEIQEMRDDRRWFKRLVYSSLFVGLVGLVYAIAQTVIIGK
jgi:hypothetical protein